MGFCFYFFCLYCFVVCLYMLIVCSASVCCLVCSSLIGKGVGGLLFEFLAYFAYYCNLYPPALTTWPCPKAWPGLIFIISGLLLLLLLAVSGAFVFSLLLDVCLCILIIFSAWFIVLFARAFFWEGDLGFCFYY